MRGVRYDDTRTQLKKLKNRTTLVFNLASGRRGTNRRTCGDEEEMRARRGHTRYETPFCHCGLISNICSKERYPDLRCFIVARPPRLGATREGGCSSVQKNTRTGNAKIPSRNLWHGSRVTGTRSHTYHIILACHNLIPSAFHIILNLRPLRLWVTV